MDAQSSMFEANLGSALGSKRPVLTPLDCNVPIADTKNILFRRNTRCVN